jgi:8-oxo-dGTP pyrophosphatase MutT (NUDIX family)
MPNNQDVKKIGLRQFLTGNFSFRQAYLSEEEFSSAFDNFVLGYVNCILVTQDKKLIKMLLVKRISDPWPNWWLPGGRMNPGESFEETAARYLSRQLGLAIEDRSRFQHLGTYSFVWGKRAFPLTGNGCHIISKVLVLKINDREAKAIKLVDVNEEYSEFTWTSPQLVVSLAGPEAVVVQTQLHLGLAHCIRDLIVFLDLKKSPTYSP